MTIHRLPMLAAIAVLCAGSTVLSNKNPHWMLHLMFFYDKSMAPAMWGVGGATNTLIDGSGLDPDAQVVMLLIPVRSWSDGASALPAATK